MADATPISQIVLNDTCVPINLTLSAGLISLTTQFGRGLYRSCRFWMVRDHGTHFITVLPTARQPFWMSESLFPPLSLKNLTGLS